MADRDAVMSVEQASFDPAWSRASWAEEIAAADEGRTGLSGLGAAVHLVARRD